MFTVLLLQRWERENAKLPAHLQRTVPEKPSSPLTVEQWNAFAWEASQVCGDLSPPEKLLVSQLIKFTEMDEVFQISLPSFKQLAETVPCPESNKSSIQPPARSLETPF